MTEVTYTWNGTYETGVDGKLGPGYVGSEDLQGTTHASGRIFWLIIIRSTHRYNILSIYLFLHAIVKGLFYPCHCDRHCDRNVIWCSCVCYLEAWSLHISSDFDWLRKSRPSSDDNACECTVMRSTDSNQQGGFQPHCGRSRQKSCLKRWLWLSEVRNVTSLHPRRSASLTIISGVSSRP